MRLIYGLILLLCPCALSAQFEGGTGSGGAHTLLASTVDCNSFFGGEASGYFNTLLPSTFNCGEFMGGGGSGAASIELKGECVMYWGDSLSGYAQNVLASTQNCLFFKGAEASGYQNDTYINPVACVSYFGSASGNDGYHTRSYSEDNGGACILVTFPIEGSPLFAELRNSDDGYLFWQTYSEYNNRGFEVQKSPNGVDWAVIGWKNGVGTTSETQDYDFWDNDLRAEIQYYRLRQLDLDGTAAYSNVVALSMSEPNISRLVQIFPNPVLSGNDLQVQTWIPDEINLTLQIRNALGQTVGTFEHQFAAGNSTFRIPTQTLAAGTYFLSIQSENRDNYWVLPFIVIY